MSAALGQARGRAGERLSHLVYPIEFDSETEPKLREARALADKELQNQARETGVCHFYWRALQRIPRERFDIEWRSPAR